jgi:hypothetical protein
MYLVCDQASGAQTCTYENEHDDLIEGFMSLAWIQVLATQVVCAVEVKAKIQDCACTSVALLLSITLFARRACARLPCPFHCSQRRIFYCSACRKRLGSLRCLCSPFRLGHIYNHNDVVQIPAPTSTTAESIVQRQQPVLLESTRWLQ